MTPSPSRIRFDGITRAGLASQDERAAIYARDGGRCRACGDPVAFDAFEVAHRIADTICNARRFGRDAIDHPLNKATTHPGRCNSRMNIGTNPVECAKLVAEIACVLHDSGIVLDE